MEHSNSPESFGSAANDLARCRCEQRYQIFSDYKESFGDNFDKMLFLNYSTGAIDIPGLALREAQTGCELYELMGWDSAKHNSTGDHKCRCKQFDEQLRFVSERSTPLSNIDYRLTLDDGRTVNGTTDNYGKTKRIKSANKPISIVKAEFFVPNDIPLCPAKVCGPGKSEEAVKTIEIKGIKTNQENVGSSVQTVIVKLKSRPLTAGEVAMARQIFNDSIDYSAVRVHNEEYLPFGLQSNKTAMTPNGSMYFNPDYFVDDFSAVDDRGFKLWFIHEMTHVWQYQLGYSVSWHGFWLSVSGGYC